MVVRPIAECFGREVHCVSNKTISSFIAQNILLNGTIYLPVTSSKASVIFSNQPRQSRSAAFKKLLLFPFPRKQMLHEAPVLVLDQHGTPTYPDSSSTHTYSQIPWFYSSVQLGCSSPVHEQIFSSLTSTFSLSPSRICGWSHEHGWLVNGLVLYGSASRFLLWEVSERASPGKQALCNGLHCIFPANRTVGACAVPRC